MGITMIDDSTQSREELIRSIRESTRQNTERINGRGNTSGRGGTQTEESTSMNVFFTFRCVVAICLFFGFLFFQYSNAVILKYDSTRLVDEISQNTEVDTVMNQVKQYIGNISAAPQTINTEQEVNTAITGQEGTLETTSKTEVETEAVQTEAQQTEAVETGVQKAETVQSEMNQTEVQ